MKKSVNFVALAIFAPVLILAGVAGFLIPEQQSLTSRFYTLLFHFSESVRSATVREG